MFYAIFYNNQLVTTVNGNGDKAATVFNNNKAFMSRYLMARLVKDGYKVEDKDLYSQEDQMLITCNITGLTRTVNLVKMATILELNERIEEILA